MSAECGFAQMVDFPTRNENNLDLFFKNRPSLIQYCYAAPGISDHDIVLTSMETKPEPIMLLILPIIPSRNSHNFYPLFLFYSHDITYYSCYIL